MQVELYKSEGPGFHWFVNRTRQKMPIGPEANVFMGQYNLIVMNRISGNVILHVLRGGELVHLWPGQMLDFGKITEDLEFFASTILLPTGTTALPKLSDIRLESMGRILLVKAK